MVWATWHILPLIQADRSLGWIAGWCVFTVAARVLISTRRVLFHLASGYPYQELFASARERLMRPRPMPAVGTG